MLLGKISFINKTNDRLLMRKNLQIMKKGERELQQKQPLVDLINKRKRKILSKTIWKKSRGKWRVEVIREGRGNVHIDRNKHKRRENVEMIFPSPCVHKHAIFLCFFTHSYIEKNLVEETF